MDKSAHNLALNSDFESVTLSQCKREIEAQLKWGSAEQWRHAEFVDLAQKVYERTGVRLSPNTLKRVWGKITYESNPSATTLNALAQYLGYENWANYRNGQNDGITVKVDLAKNLKSPFLSHRLSWFIAALLVCGTTVWWMLPSHDSSAVPLKEETLISHPAGGNHLSLEKTSDDVPNTVIFKYDLTGVEGEVFQIQQNWDRRLRFDIDPKGSTISSTYYLPGYWHAKLLVDGMIVEETDVYIATKGWLGTIDLEPIPIYYREDDIRKESIKIDDADIDQANQPHLQTPTITYHYIKEFPEVQVDDLSLEMELRNTQTGGQAACRFTNVTLVGTSGRLVIALSIKGCVGDLRLRAGDAVMDAKEHDLSELGCDFSRFQTLKCDVSQWKARIVLNEKLVATIPYQESMGRFAGVRVKFQGRGEIKRLLVRDPSGRHLIEHGIF